MGYLELALIGVGLSMDAFAVSVCKGLSMRKVDKKYMFVLAAFFGGFQALMPALGWLLGSQFQSYITAIDHWIAFILLVLIGGKMILDVVKEKGEHEEVCPEGSVRIDLREFFLLAIATSIDALFGSKFKDKATILGGIILIGIGVKILIEHLGLFG